MVSCYYLRHYQTLLSHSLSSDQGKLQFHQILEQIFLTFPKGLPVCLDEACWAHQSQKSVCVCKFIYILSRSVQDYTKIMHNREVMYAPRWKSQKQPQNRNWTHGCKMLALKWETWKVGCTHGARQLQSDKRRIDHLLPKKPVKAKESFTGQCPKLPPHKMESGVWYPTPASGSVRNVLGLVSEVSPGRCACWSWTRSDRWESRSPNPRLNHTRLF